MATFNTSSNKSCSASLINENWVVTAASWYFFTFKKILIKFSSFEKRVQMNLGKCEEGTCQIINSSRMIPHSQYSASTGKNDIMLIKLSGCWVLNDLLRKNYKIKTLIKSKPVTLNQYVQPVALPSRGVKKILISRR